MSSRVLVTDSHLGSGSPDAIARYSAALGEALGLQWEDLGRRTVRVTFQHLVGTDDCVTTSFVASDLNARAMRLLHKIYGL